jgi:hypothetical protein
MFRTKDSSAMIPFSYAIIDDEGEVIRKHRWSVKEAKWFTENNPDVKVIKLDKPKEVKEDLFQLVGECLF